MGDVAPRAMSLRAYAKRRDVTLGAVQKAIATGRLDRSVGEVAGQPKIVDPDLADLEWEERTRRRADPADEPATPDPDSYSEARRRRELENWHQAKIKREMDELDLAARKGELVSVHELRSAVIEKFTVVRTKLLGLPARVKQRMPHIGAADVLVIDDLVREALEELADG